MHWDSRRFASRRLAPVDVFKKNLEDGSWALGFFNRGDTPREAKFNKLKLKLMGIPEKFQARDLWRQQDLPDAQGNLNVSIAPHGVMLLKLTPVKK